MKTRLLWYSLVAGVALQPLLATAGRSSHSRSGPAQQILQSSDDVMEELETEDRDVWNAASIRRDLMSALETMQHEYFEVWIGQWPTSIDWTGAVLGTHVSATLDTLSRFSEQQPPSSKNVNETRCDVDSRLLDDQINGYFSQLQAYYFGENAFGFRLQAHDDMLWVVLGWLEAIKFIDAHDKRRHPHIRNVSNARNASNASKADLTEGFGKHWHGMLFKPAFAHRAHVFFDIVSSAWDDSLCGGGLTWNPHLSPYKNAVTNEQLISAAIGMYLYHPGDTNTAPFISTAVTPKTKDDPSSDPNTQLPPSQPHDISYLFMAQMAYRWFTSKNFTNAHGLYVDGFHVRSHWDPARHRRVYGACDLRTEMVYTYNQGIILSGQRQLWEGTGQTSYLQDGHALIRSVIDATGWPHRSGTAWRGLGYNGILHEFCDSRGTCGQDAQTFKGIFFLHLSAFCEPLPVLGLDEPLLPGKTHLADKGTASLHASDCRGYIRWVEANARGARGTRNERGVIGGWWSAPKLRVDGMHKDDKWMPEDAVMPELPRPTVDYPNEGMAEGGYTSAAWKTDGWDFNDRGRGRTVESHSSGLAVLRALYVLKMNYE